MEDIAEEEVLEGIGGKHVLMSSLGKTPGPILEAYNSLPVTNKSPVWTASRTPHVQGPSFSHSLVLLKSQWNSDRNTTRTTIQNPYRPIGSQR